MRSKKSFWHKSKLVNVISVALLAYFAVFFMLGVARRVDKGNIEASQPVVQKTVEAEVPEEPKISVQGLLEATNKERKKAGVKPLILDERLNASAQRKVQQLNIDGWNDYSHIGSDGKHGYEYAQSLFPECLNAGENLTGISPKTEFNISTESAFDSWFRSEPHREAILDSRYEYVGFAFDDKYAVQHFCSID